MKKLVLLVDFTGVCVLAMEHVALIASESLCRVILLHIASPDKESSPKEAEQEVRSFAEPLEKEGVPFAIHVKFGDFFELITHEMKTISPDLLVVGTHGFKGIKKNFQSSNILNLLRLIDCPSLIVQGHASTPMEGYKSILAPLISEKVPEGWLLPLKMFSTIFKSDVHLLSYHNDGNQQIMQQKCEDIKKFLNDDSEIKSIIEMEETSLYTASYSRSIIEYSDIEENDVIVLLLGKKEEDYFNITDQENILLNRLGKPILCL